MFFLNNNNSNINNNNNININNNNNNSNNTRVKTNYKITCFGVVITPLSRKNMLDHANYSIGREEFKLLYIELIDWPKAYGEFSKSAPVTS